MVFTMVYFKILKNNFLRKNAQSFFLSNECKERALKLLCVVLCSITACYPVSKIWDGLLGSKITNRGSRPNAQAN